MNILPLVSDGSAHKARVKNLNLQHRMLPPELKPLLREYEQLAKEINEYPSRVAGLRMNYRKREMPARVEALLTEREQKITKLLEMERILFPKT